MAGIKPAMTVELEFLREAKPLSPRIERRSDLGDVA